MGYWSSDPDGSSFAKNSELVWGDRPADVMDEAIQVIIHQFTQDVGREPTKTELMAGFRFSCRNLELEP